MARFSGGAMTSEQRRFISNFIIAAAARMPRAMRGPLHQLQDIRQRQDRDAAQTVKRARLPDHLSFSYSGFVATEIFPIEEAKAVGYRLMRLFRMSGDADPITTLREYAANPRITGWQKVGVLYKNDRPFPPGTYATRYTPGLPASISHIDVHLSRFSKSSIAIQCFVFASEEASNEIRQLSLTPILPPVELNDFRPNRLGYAHSFYSADMAKADTSRDYFALLRRNAMSSIMSAFSGLGCVWRQNEKRGFPCIDIFEITGTSDCNSDWLSESRGWRFCLGIDMERDYLAKSDAVLGIEDSDIEKPLMWPLFLTTEKRSDTKYAMRARGDDYEFLRTCSYFQAVIAYGRSITHRMADFRERAYRRSSHISGDARLFEKLLRERLLASEYAADVQRFSLNGLGDSFLDSLRYHSGFMPNATSTSSGSGIVVSWSQNLYAQLTADMTSLIDYFSAVVSTRNIRTSFSVARWALIVAAFSLGASILFGVLTLRGDSASAAKTTSNATTPAPKAASTTRPHQSHLPGTHQSSGGSEKLRSHGA